MRISDWSSDVCSSDLPADLLYLEQQIRRELRAQDIDPDQPGLRITTTINQQMQDAARQSAADVREGVHGEGRAALVSVERSEERGVGNESVSTCRYRG